MGSQIIQRGRTARRAGVEYAGAGAEAEDTGAGAVVSGSQIMQVAHARHAWAPGVRTCVRAVRVSMLEAWRALFEGAARTWVVDSDSLGRARTQEVSQGARN